MTETAEWKNILSFCLTHILPDITEGEEFITSTAVYEHGKIKSSWLYS